MYERLTVYSKSLNVLKVNVKECVEEDLPEKKEEWCNRGDSFVFFSHPYNLPSFRTNIHPFDPVVTGEPLDTCRTAPDSLSISSKYFSRSSSDVK
jgi:hypothetical protein